MDCKRDKIAENDLPGMKKEIVRIYFPDGWSSPDVVAGTDPIGKGKVTIIKK